MSDMIRVPQSRWGGRYLKPLKDAWDRGDIALHEADEPAVGWLEVGQYARTVAYQAARILNLGSVLPQTPPGTHFEFGARANNDGTSTVLVRLVEDE